ncbi:MAG: thioredoxin [Chloroflexi bacterium]|nr:thioredoxin [Chloroflexota bacterium]MCI0822150.1 thioredoxin [Chloroflexota bacterium]
MAKPITVTDANFDEEVLQSETPVLVDFWAEWCGPCKAIAPVVDELAEEYDGRVKFAKLDVDSNPKTPMNYGIRGIPAMLIFNGGSVAKQVVGAVPKASLKKSIDEAIAG